VVCVARITSVRALMQIAVQYDLIVHQMNVKTAYLNADNTRLDMLIRPSPDKLRAEEGRYWRPHHDADGNPHPYPSLIPGEFPVDPRPTPDPSCLSIPAPVL